MMIGARCLAAALLVSVLASVARAQAPDEQAPSAALDPSVG